MLTNSATPSSVVLAPHLRLACGRNFSEAAFPPSAEWLEVHWESAHIGHSNKEIHQELNCYVSYGTV